jgi:putative phosphoesterase
MATKLLLLSDTHVPQRARALPELVWRGIDEVDVVLHAGDWVDAALLDEIEDRAELLIGVHGNNDGPELRARLPEIARVEIEGLCIAMIHETGPASGRELRMDEAFPDSDLLVFGHSHIPWDTVSPRGLRLLNPGSPTDRRRQPVGTVMTATVDRGSLDDVTLVPVSSAAIERK